MDDDEIILLSDDEFTIPVVENGGRAGEVTKKSLSAAAKQQPASKSAEPAGLSPGSKIQDLIESPILNRSRMLTRRNGSHPSSHRQRNGEKAGRHASHPTNLFLESNNDDTNSEKEDDDSDSDEDEEDEAVASLDESPLEQARSNGDEDESPPSHLQDNSNSQLDQLDSIASSAASPDTTTTATTVNTNANINGGSKASSNSISSRPENGHSSPPSSSQQQKQSSSGASAFFNHRGGSSSLLGNSFLPSSRSSPRALAMLKAVGRGLAFERDLPGNSTSSDSDSNGSNQGDNASLRGASQQLSSPPVTAVKSRGRPRKSPSMMSTSPSISSSPLSFAAAAPAAFSSCSVSSGGAGSNGAASSQHLQSTIASSTATAAGNTGNSSTTNASTSSSSTGAQFACSSSSSNSSSQQAATTSNSSSSSSGTLKRSLSTGDSSQFAYLNPLAILMSAGSPKRSSTYVPRGMSRGSQALRALRAMDWAPGAKRTSSATASSAGASTSNTTPTTTTSNSSSSATRSILRPPSSLGRTPTPNGKQGRVSFAAPLVTCELYFDAAQTSIGLDQLFTGGGPPSMDKLKPAVAANSIDSSETPFSAASGTCASAAPPAFPSLMTDSDSDDDSSSSAADLITTPRCAIKRMKTDDDSVVVTSIEVRAREEYDSRRMVTRMKDRGSASPLTRIDLFGRCATERAALPLQPKEKETPAATAEPTTAESDNAEVDSVAAIPTEEVLLELETGDLVDYREHLKEKEAAADSHIPTSEEVISLMDAVQEAEQDILAAAAAAAQQAAEAASQAAAATSTTVNRLNGGRRRRSGTRTRSTQTVTLTRREPMINLRLPVSVVRSILAAYDEQLAQAEEEDSRRFQRLRRNLDQQEQEEHDDSLFFSCSPPVAEEGVGSSISSSLGAAGEEEEDYSEGDDDDLDSETVRDTARRTGDPTVLEGRSVAW